MCIYIYTWSIYIYLYGVYKFISDCIANLVVHLPISCCMSPYLVVKNSSFRRHVISILSVDGCKILRHHSRIVETCWNPWNPRNNGINMDKYPGYPRNNEINMDKPHLSSAWYLHISSIPMAPWSKLNPWGRGCCPRAPMRTPGAAQLQGRWVFGNAIGEYRRAGGKRRRTWDERWRKRTVNGGFKHFSFSIIYGIILPID